MSQERRENCETSTTLIDGFSFYQTICARFAWEGKNNETPCHATGKALENAIYLYCLKCEHVGEGGGEDYGTRYYFREHTPTMTELSTDEISFAIRLKDTQDKTGVSIFN